MHFGWNVRVFRLIKMNWQLTLLKQYSSHTVLSFCYKIKKKSHLNQSLWLKGKHTVSGSVLMTSEASIYVDSWKEKAHARFIAGRLTWTCYCPAGKLADEPLTGGNRRDMPHKKWKPCERTFNISANVNSATWFAFGLILVLSVLHVAPSLRTK